MITNEETSSLNLISLTNCCGSECMCVAAANKPSLSARRLCMRFLTPRLHTPPCSPRKAPGLQGLPGLRCIACALDSNGASYVGLCNNVTKLRKTIRCQHAWQTWTAEELLDRRAQADVHHRVHAFVDWVHNEGNSPQTCNRDLSLGKFQLRHPEQECPVVAALQVQQHVCRQRLLDC